MEFKIKFNILLTLLILDFSFTSLGIYFVGIIYELNPFVRFLYSINPIFYWISVSFLIFSSILVLPEHSKLANKMFIFMIPLYVIAIGFHGTWIMEVI